VLEELHASWTPSQAISLRQNYVAATRKFWKLEDEATEAVKSSCGKVHRKYQK
jgi:hypothetical protein